MFNKQLVVDTLLPLSVLVALLRLQWDPASQMHRVEITGIHDIILGESVALTETRFHSWYSTYEDESVQIHPKHVDSGVYSRSIFNELHSLNNRNRLLSLIPAGLEITALLLDDDESYSRRNVNIPPQPQVVSPDDNGDSQQSEVLNELSSDADVNNNRDGAAVASPDSGCHDMQELSPEDIDIIEALWRQDIDMGVTREDTFPSRRDVESEKAPQPVDDKAPPQSDWQYDIDCETGEHLTVLPTEPPIVDSIPSAPDQASPIPDSGSLSFEDCLYLLDGFNPEASQHHHHQQSSRTVPPLVDAVEIEQRWQDLASISELQLVSEADGSPHGFSNSTWNSSRPVEEQNVFAFNATTNGNVNLQNATSPRLPLFSNASQPMADDRLLTVDIQDGQLFPAASEAHMNTSSSPNLFSPISRFNSMSIDCVPPSPVGSQGSSVNLTMLMMEQQALDLPSTLENGSISPAPQNGSLLLELLNSTAAGGREELLDSDMHQLDNMIDMLATTINGEDGMPMDLSEDDSSISEDESEDSFEGAVGFNQDAFKGEIRKGFNRGGASPCHSNAGSSSSADSSQNADSIHHNHSYASSSSDTSSRKNFRSSNGSQNSTSDDDDDFSRPSRDAKRAEELNIPIPIEKIIDLPVDNFNGLLKKYTFNAEQTQLIRDIRRRGKNKVAAQNCRKRKISAIAQVEGSLGAMQNEHDKLLKERDKGQEELARMQDRFDELYGQVFQNMRGRDGGQLDPDRYRLEVMDDGSVVLVPRDGGTGDVEHPAAADKKYSSN